MRPKSHISMAKQPFASFLNTIQGLFFFEQMTTGSFAFILHENILLHTPAHIQGVFAQISENDKFLEGNGDSGAQNLDTKDCNSTMLAVLTMLAHFQQCENSPCSMQASPQPSEAEDPNHSPWI